MTTLVLDGTGLLDVVSPSQQARILTERWVKASRYCPACGHAPLQQFPNNQPAADFFCVRCDEQYELKSKNGPLGRKIVDGAFQTMIDRITSDTNPNLMLLSYSREHLAVERLETIPKQFFTTDIIERRPPLGPHARRAGWVGCNIVVEQVVDAGRIKMIQDGRVRPVADVVGDWQRTVFVRGRGDVTARGWLLAVMRCIDAIPTRTFQIKDVYAFEGGLSAKFPGNNNVRAKIRQQLQVLRDAGYLSFIGRGSYARCV